MTVKTITPVTSTYSGAVFTTVALGATDTAFEFVNDGGTLLFIENGTVGSVNATPSANSVNGVPLAPAAVAIGAGAIKHFGPFDPQLFNSSGKVTITISAPATTIKAYAVKLK